MRDIRFYEEFTSKRRNQSTGNAVAIVVNQGRNSDGSHPAIAPLYDSPNSPVASTEISDGYLWKFCKRVSEARARQVHPELFKYLDAD